MFGLGLLAKTMSIQSSSIAQKDVQVPQKAESAEKDESEPVKNEPLQPAKIKKLTADIVREYFKDTPLLQDIAWCESEFRQFNSEGQVLRGNIDPDDIGVMQINARYHLVPAKALGLDIYTIEGNLAYAKKLFEREGSRPWKASSKCWISRSNKVIANK